MGEVSGALAKKCGTSSATLVGARYEIPAPVSDDATGSRAQALILPHANSSTKCRSHWE